jgi:hypothetical protein
LVTFSDGENTVVPWTSLALTGPFGEVKPWVASLKGRLVKVVDQDDSAFNGIGIITKIPTATAEGEERCVYTTMLETIDDGGFIPEPIQRPLTSLEVSLQPGDVVAVPAGLGSLHSLYMRLGLVKSHDLGRDIVAVQTHEEDLRFMERRGLVLVSLAPV